ncbi:hypothetical protein [uncultured Pseudacidovorax sp.]|uniref:hypothetical protein n=1 Tax=uncultured Pseudacidovorax sp. TaxID=679313 RepID=UPI0025ECB4A3|nr:hypothetical protein [uncultured Pseudacidovorax sp.]
MSMDEWLVIASAMAAVAAGGALGAALVLALCWRRLLVSAADVVEARMAPQLAALRQEQQRMPQSVQQALQVELEFHLREQAERSDRQAAELREFLRTALAAYGWIVPTPIPPTPPPAPEAAWPPTAGPGVAPPLDAVPPPEAPGLAHLSDAEIDALPPDLPAPRKARPALRPPPGIPTQKL